MLAVMAPAGYGKSTLLAQWADQQRRPIAWLSADERDGDPATLLRGIAAAMDRATGLDASVLDAVAIPGPSVWSMAVPRIGAAIAASRPFTLVIDDVDRIGGDEALDVLVTLIGYLGPGSKLGVAGRGTGALPGGATGVPRPGRPRWAAMPWRSTSARPTRSSGRQARP